MQHNGGEWFLRLRADGVCVLLDRRGVRVGRLRDEAALFLREADAREARARERAPP
jgi:hypothetical protein